MMKDRLGIKLSPGDYVAYSVTAGRSGVLHIGRVVNVVQRKADYMHPRDYEKAKIELLEEGFGGEAYRLQLTGKPKIVYIEFPERIVVVNHYVPKPKKESVQGGA